MKKLILSSLCMLMGLTSMSAQTALQNEILEVANRTKTYQQPLDPCRILRGIDGALRD